MSQASEMEQLIGEKSKVMSKERERYRYIEAYGKEDVGSQNSYQAKPQFSWDSKPVRCFCCGEAHSD